MRLFFSLAVLLCGTAYAQDPLPEPIPETVPLSAIGTGGASIAPCACGATAQAKVFPEGEVFTVHVAEDPECVAVEFTVLNFMDMSQAYRMTIGSLPAGGLTMTTTVISVDEPSWCDKVCDISWEWHHGLPSNDSPCLKELIKQINDKIKEDNKATEKENEGKPEAQKKALVDEINVDDGKWGTALPKDCHRLKNGLHGRGPNGDWITWKDIWEMWCKKWKEANGDKLPTEEDLKKALDAIWKDDLKNACPSIHPDDVDYGKTSKGKKKILRPGGFAGCKAKGCDVGMSKGDWDKLDGPGKADAVRKKCCPSKTDPCKKKDC